MSDLSNGEVAKLPCAHSSGPSLVHAFVCILQQNLACHCRTFEVSCQLHQEVANAVWPDLRCVAFISLIQMLTGPSFLQLAVLRQCKNTCPICYVAIGPRDAEAGDGWMGPFGFLVFDRISD